MMDDKESIALRKNHAEWMKTSTEAKECLEELETVAHAHPTLFARLFVRYMRWAARKCAEGEEEARIEARRTYGP